MTSCRLCSAPLDVVFADLGMSPLSNAYVPLERLAMPELFHPLVARVCERCFLVQLPTAENPEQIFRDYLYFSSYSEEWLAHARKFAADVTRRLALRGDSQVVEIASNDGYLLQYFKQADIPVLGIEPAANVAAAATQRGIETWTKFFGTATAQEIAGRSDLLIANNVLAHVPELHDFVEGMRIALAPQGTISIEVPHLLQLIRSVEFDTIYHEHFSYFSLSTLKRLLAEHGLVVTDVEELPTHGGSIRVYASHAPRESSSRVEALLETERRFGLSELETYRRFAAAVCAAKRTLLEFLIEARREGKRIAGYGAPAKASTLLNYCGIRTDFIEYTVDRSPHKQGLHLPGTRIPILAPSHVAEARPDYLVILVWNLRNEVMSQMAHIRDWGGKFVIPIPKLEVLC